MVKYGYIVPPIQITISSEVCSCLCQQAIANELAEANRLKRMEITLEYPTRTELGFTLVKNEQLEDQA